MKGLFIKGVYKNEEFEFHAYEELGKVRLENKYKHDTFFIFRCFLTFLKYRYFSKIKTPKNYSEHFL